jgi:hypothetical protein
VPPDPAAEHGRRDPVPEYHARSGSVVPARTRTWQVVRGDVDRTAPGSRSGCPAARGTAGAAPAAARAPRLCRR